MISNFFRTYILNKLKFASTSAVATVVDYTIFLTLSTNYLSPLVANLISYSCGMLTNFFLQKRFIFTLKRKWHNAFILSIGFSMFGLVLNTFIVALLSRYEFFYSYQIITKVIASGVVFFYNYYSKRLAFEKK